MRKTKTRLFMEEHKQQILHLYKGGMNKTEIAKKLNISRTTLGDYLREWGKSKFTQRTPAGARIVSKPRIPARPNLWDRFISMIKDWREKLGK